MPKHKKTFKQKILADKRREAQDISLYSLPKELLKKEIKSPSSSIKQGVVVVNTTPYDYLAGDLGKTAIFTGFIVLLELVLKNFIR